MLVGVSITGGSEADGHVGAGGGGGNGVGVGVGISGGKY